MEHVFYHRDLDGLFSAYWYRELMKKNRVAVTFSSIQYSEEIVVPDGATALTFLDFCPPKEFIAENIGIVQVFDHHPIAKEMAEIFPVDKVCYFAEKAGACLGMMGMYLNNAGYICDCTDCEKFRFLTNAVARRDVFTHDVIDNIYIAALGALCDLEDPTLNVLVTMDIESIRATGKLLLDSKDQKIKAIVDKVNEYPSLYIRGYAIDRVMLVNVSDGELLSDVGNILSKQHNIVVGCYRIGAYNKDGTMAALCSFRSQEGFPVTARDVAMRYGGGGHNEAAGCTIQLPVLFDGLTSEGGHL